MTPCPTCGHARTLVGVVTICLNPLCETADIIHADAVARIVIEKREGHILTSWWKSDQIDGFHALRLSGEMLVSAAELLGSGLLTAMRGMARRN